jgi:hypothetical protein
MNTKSIFVLISAFFYLNQINAAEISGLKLQANCETFSGKLENSKKLEGITTRHYPADFSFHNGAMIEETVNGRTVYYLHLAPVKNGKKDLLTLLVSRTPSLEFQRSFLSEDPNDESEDAKYSRLVPGPVSTRVLIKFNHRSQKWVLNNQEVEAFPLIVTLTHKGADLEQTKRCWSKKLKMHDEKITCRIDIM